MFNPQQIASHLAKLLPNKQNEIQQAINQATQATQGQNDSNAGKIARSFGMTPQAVNEMYNKFNNLPAPQKIAANTALSMLGLNADTLKNEALNILGMEDDGNSSQVPFMNNNNGNRQAPAKTQSPNRFPRLK